MLPQRLRLIDTEEDTRTSNDDHPSSLPENIGPYRVQRVIASGGMGTVYEALQENPRRTVALKVIRAGITSRSAMRRFEYETQILARLRHPGIAQIYESGTHERNGVTVPFFAMEYIPSALPITAYAQRHALKIDERLALFNQVCDALRHGHQKGIIHRDLKPGNILVDSQGAVKIIDFGVARATDSDMAVTTLQTDVGQLVGTMRYMSPEQIQADPHDIDTRSDVYTIGVVLFELLAGQLPYAVRDRPVHEVARIIREQSPARLTRVNRHANIDLETVTLKALEKNKTRRYQSVTELRQDIDNYLQGHAITARRPSLAYQLQLMARRHRGILWGAVGVFIASFLGMIASTSLYIRSEVALSAEAEQRYLAEQARLDAEQARAAEAKQRRIAETSREEAQRQSQIALAVNQFLNEDILAIGAPEYLGPEATLRDVLDFAARHVDQRFPDQPLIAAEIHFTLGNTYMDCGLLDEATTHLRAAAYMWQAGLGQDDPNTLTARNDLAMVFEQSGRLEQSLKIHEDTFKRRTRVLGAEHPDTLNSQANLAWLIFRLGRHDEGIRMTEDNHAIRCRLWGEQDLRTLDTMNNLAAMYDAIGRHQEAETMHRKVLDGNAVLKGPDDLMTLVSKANLAGALVSRGVYDEARDLYEDVLAARRRLLGSGHQHTLVLMNNLAILYWKMEEPERTVALLDEALTAGRAALGADNPTVISLCSLLGRVYNRLDRFDEALPLHATAVQSAAAYLPDGHQLIGVYLTGLGRCQMGLQRYDDAERTLLEAETILRRSVGREHEDWMNVSEALATLYTARGRERDAARWRG